MMHEQTLAVRPANATLAAFAALVRRDLKLAGRDSGSAGTVVGFYLIVVALMPLGLGPDPGLLTRIAPGILWIALLLAALLATARMFESDAEDGSLDVLALSPIPLEGVAVAKIVVHWLTIAVPLIVAAPLLGLLLNLDIGAFGVLVASMLLGTPAISAIGAIGAALTLKARKGGLLVALLVLPLYIPTLIFGISAVSGATSGMVGAATAPLLILSAISLGAFVLSAWATAAALAAHVR
jgi:heme exporter protein B